jgi:hypothetical protein
MADAEEDAMSNADNQVRAQVAAALEAAGTREQLLQELTTYSHDPRFGACADLWAPALCDRDAHFFAPFLLDHLRGGQEDVIRVLLPRLEASGEDALFHRLYRRIADEATWNEELGQLAQSPLADAEVLRALERRTVAREREFDLAEATALALYRRNPQVFRAFLLDQITGGWESEHPHYADLRAAARRQGDDALYWALFRRLAAPAEWAESIRALLREDAPAPSLSDELAKRHPEFIEELDGGVLADVLDRYGAAALPYIEHHTTLVSRKGASRLLQSAEKLGDDALYWRLFFKAGKPAAWNKALLALAHASLPDAEYRQALAHRTPPITQRGAWNVTPETAFALYRRDPGLARHFLVRWLAAVDRALFTAAEQADDEEMLDALSTRLILQVAPLVSAAFLTQSEQTWKKPDAHARAELEDWERVVSARFDRLVAEAPATYVAHAVRILGALQTDEDWSFKRNVAHNPVFSYLYYQHRAGWRAAPSAIRDLLESSCHAAQLVALAALAEGGPDAALRVVENLPLLAALLVSDTARNSKKLVLATLERAALESADAAERILPALEEVMHFHALASIDERILVCAVRLRHHYAPQGAGAALA